MKKIKFILLLLLLVTLSSCEITNQPKDEPKEPKTLEQLVEERRYDFVKTIELINSNYKDVDLKYLNNEEIKTLENKDSTFQYLKLDSIVGAVFLIYKKNQSTVYASMVYQYENHELAESDLKYLNTMFPPFFVVDDNILYWDLYNTNIFFGDYKIDGKHCLSKDGSKYLDYFGEETELIVPSGVKEIGNNAFAFTDVKKLTLNKELIKVGSILFSSTNYLEEIVFNDSLEIIGHSSFRNCNLLKELNLPDSVKEIGDYAFAECDSLNSVEIPSSVEKIGKGAFCRCDNLKTLTINLNSNIKFGNYIVMDGNKYLKIVLVGKLPKPIPWNDYTFMKDETKAQYEIIIQSTDE